MPSNTQPIEATYLSGPEQKGIADQTILKEKEEAAEKGGSCPVPGFLRQVGNFIVAPVRLFIRGVSFITRSIADFSCGLYRRLANGFRLVNFKVRMYIAVHPRLARLLRAVEIFLKIFGIAVAAAMGLFIIFAFSTQMSLLTAWVFGLLGIALSANAIYVFELCYFAVFFYAYAMTLFVWVDRRFFSSQGFSYTTL